MQAANEFSAAGAANVTPVCHICLAILTNTCLASYFILLASGATGTCTVNAAPPLATQHADPLATVPPLLQPVETRYRSFRVRFISSIVLIASFLAIIWAGHVPLMFMVLGIQVGAALRCAALRLLWLLWLLELLRCGAGFRCALPAVPLPVCTPPQPFPNSAPFTPTGFQP
jgi:hypothetical protein